MPTKTLEHPALDHMAAMPDIIRALLTGISDEQVYAKPADGGLSIAELLEKMSHIEAHCHRARFDEILASENAEVEPYDRNAFHAQGTYSGRDAEESLAHWEEQREDNLELLRGLEPKVLSRKGRHPALGSFTLENLLNQWAAGDLGHVRELAALVRAQLYDRQSGSLHLEYDSKP